RVGCRLRRHVALPHLDRARLGAHAGGAPLTEGSRGRLVLTIDVERDWAGNGTRGIDEALPWLLERLLHHGATATFFVVADLTGEVRGMLDPGGPHEIGSHGLTHDRLDRIGGEAVRR